MISLLACIATVMYGSSKGVTTVHMCLTYPKKRMIQIDYNRTRAYLEIWESRI